MALLALAMIGSRIQHLSFSV